MVRIGIAIPKQFGRFGLLGSRDSFGLQVGASVAGEFVGSGDCGRLVDGHEFGEEGEDGCEERTGGGGAEECRRGGFDGKGAVYGVCTGDREGRGGGMEGVEGVGGGGDEGDEFVRGG